MKPLDPRAAELLCDEVLAGLDEAEQRELAALLGDDLERERHHVALAAAAVDLAHLPAEPEALPESLRLRVLAQAAAALPSGAPAAGAPAAGAPAADAPPANDARPAPAATGGGAAPAGEARPARPARAALPWLIAAACLAAAVVALVVRPPPPPATVTVVTVSVSVPVPPPPPPPAAARRERLLASGGAVRSDWGGTKDPAAAGASGDVVWNTSTQEGYMRFAGLPVNDPHKEQYQLWIFDRTQDERHPIDGGVFDVGPGGEVVVPITAKIQVREPTLFAVTIEKPGGVVVSSRKRLVLAAKVPAG